MARRSLRLLTVGRLRSPHWKAAAEHYQDRLKRWLDLREDCLADGAAALAPAARSVEESNRLLAALTPRDLLICLDERGASYSSRDFAALLARLGEDANRVPCFVVGGAFGLSEAVRGQARHIIAFGPLTLPHELARVVLLEQIYRAECINRKVPYHHD